jgi:hypothetical protein
LVNLSVQKFKPAFAGKSIAVAVLCVGKAAEPKAVQRQISFFDQEQGRTHLLALLA